MKLCKKVFRLDAQQNNLITLPSIINQSSGKIIVKNTQGLQQELFIINNDKPNYLNIREIYFNNNTFNVKNGKENKPVLINWYGAVFYCNMLSRIEGYSELYNLNNQGDAEFFTDLANACAKRSEWTLTSGIPSNVFIDIASETIIRMNKLVIESKSNYQQTINHLFEINKSYISENSLKDISTYKAWLSEKKHLTDEPILNLASLAWDIGNYRLSYNLAEIEDMIDAGI